VLRVEHFRTDDGLEWGVDEGHSPHILTEDLAFVPGLSRSRLS
jgi:hypothetical protein